MQVPFESKCFILAPRKSSDLGKKCHKIFQQFLYSSYPSKRNAKFFILSPQNLREGSKTIGISNYHNRKIFTYRWNRVFFLHIAAE